MGARLTDRLPDENSQFSVRPTVFAKFDFTQPQFATSLSASKGQIQSMGRPKKTITLPVGLEEALRIALPKYRPEDRMSLMRAWARYNLGIKLWKFPTDEEFETEWKGWCKKQFKDTVLIYDLSANLKLYIPVHTIENRKKRGSIAAKTRWLKKQRKLLIEIIHSHFLQ